MPELAVVVPTRGRPENIRKVISAWDFTNTWDDADLVLAIDADDPEYQRYLDIVSESRHPDTGDPLIRHVTSDQWVPMVIKLNVVALRLSEEGLYAAIGFAGDDHLPQTIGWAKRYLTVLAELGTGMVYGDDGYQGRKLSTEWAVTADAVRALGRMVPAPVEHMYCDNSMMDLFGEAGAMRHLPEVRIEHMHPVAGKGKTDAQYDRVNHRDQFKKDRQTYDRWRLGQMAADVATIRALRPGLPEVHDQVRTPRPASGSGPRPSPFPRKGTSMGRNFPFPRHFKQVRGATPDEIGIALADFASQVPNDQEIVELGVFQGRTALMMAWGAQQGRGAHVTAIDPWDLPGNVYDPPFTDPGSKAWARYWVQSLGYNNHIRLIQGFSHDVASSWPEPWFSGGKTVGLLYVDGDHTKAGARRDIEAWAQHLAPGAIIAVDDYGHADWPGVREAVDELVAEGFLQPVEVFHDRLAVTRLADVIERTDPVPELKPSATITAMTSDGVSPSPYPAVGGQVAAGPESLPEAVVAVEAPKVDTSTSTEKRPLEIVHAGELDGVVGGTPVSDLNLVHLKALAKHRGIVLGIRKDKRDLILQALRDGA